MLLKYLNELDQAVRELDQHPAPESLAHCAECVRVLEEYLDSQMEPVARRGREIMAEMVPASLYARLVGAGPARERPAKPAGRIPETCPKERRHLPVLREPTANPAAVACPKQGRTRSWTTQRQ